VGNGEKGEKSAVRAEITGAQGETWKSEGDGNEKGRERERGRAEKKGERLVTTSSRAQPSYG